MDKATALLEARCFGERDVSARRCMPALLGLLWTLNQGKETLTQREATDAFFGATRLFRHPDAHLRRACHLLVKGLSPLVGSDEALMVISSLSKDVAGQSQTSGGRGAPTPEAARALRASAVRALCEVVDVATLPQVERALRQCIVDDDGLTSSAALAGAARLLERAVAAGTPALADVVGRWGAEVAEAGGRGRDPRARLAAVILQHALRRTDRLAASKLVGELQRDVVSGLPNRGGDRGTAAPAPALAEALVARYVARLLEGTAPGPGGTPRAGADYLADRAGHRDPTVALEACRAIVNLGLPGAPSAASAVELAPAVEGLRRLLGSARPAVRLGAVRCLARAAALGPVGRGAAAAANAELEGLVSDPSRDVAAVAVRVLLETGDEASVDGLVANLRLLVLAPSGGSGPPPAAAAATAAAAAAGSSAASPPDAEDAFRVDAVRAVRHLCLRYPSRHRALLGFLAGALREEGTLPVKRALVEAVVALARGVPRARDAALAALCEFIEDCEWPELSRRVLAVVAEEAPRGKRPGRYVRHLHNRVILEAPATRAAAVGALAKLARRACRGEGGGGAEAASEAEGLRRAVAGLLRRAATDADDEVRDRAAAALAALEDDEGLVAAPAAGAEGRGAAPRGWSARLRAAAETRPLDLERLEAGLRGYLEAGAWRGDAARPFDLASVPTGAGDGGWGPEEDARAASAADADSAAAASSAPDLAPLGGGSGPSAPRPAGGPGAAAHDPGSAWAPALTLVPELSSLGPPAHSTPPRPLLDEGLEYLAAYVAHWWVDPATGAPSRCVLHVRATSTVADAQVCSDVRVVADLRGGECPGLVEEFSVPLAGDLPAADPATGGRDAAARLSAGAGLVDGGAADAFVCLSVVDPATGAPPDPDAAAAALAAGGVPPLPPSGYVPLSLAFTSREVDPSTGAPDPDDPGAPEEYPLEPAALPLSDHMRGWPCASTLAEWTSSWDELGAQAAAGGGQTAAERTADYDLGAGTGLAQRAAALAAATGLGSAGGAGAEMPTEGARSGAVLLSGFFRGVAGGARVCARARLAVHPATGGVALRLEARAAGGGGAGAAACLAVHAAITG